MITAIITAAVLAPPTPPPAPQPPAHTDPGDTLTIVLDGHVHEVLESCAGLQLGHIRNARPVGAHPLMATEFEICVGFLDGDPTKRFWLRFPRKCPRPAVSALGPASGGAS